MRQFEQRLLDDSKESQTRNDKDDVSELIQRLENEKSTGIQEQKDLLLKFEQESKQEKLKLERGTKIMICMMNFVKDMLKQKLVDREQELQLEMI